MIELNFIAMEPYSQRLSADIQSWTIECSERAFLGGQIFKIDGSDFSGDYPILGFARNLNVIASKLKVVGQSESYLDPEDPARRTKFTLEENGFVSVQLLDRFDNVISSANTPLLELVAKSAEYLERVYAHCCSLFFPLRDSVLIQKWLLGDAPLSL